MLAKVVEVVKMVASEEIMPKYQNTSAGHKKDGSLLTEADLAAQKKLEELLRDIYDVDVLGEEMTVDEQKAVLSSSSGRFIWCIDPIDGTSNFVNGLPYFAVSVALMEKGRSVLGVVYDPVRDEVFAAEKGLGAHVNNIKIGVGPSDKNLKNGVAQVDFKRLPSKVSKVLLEKTPYASQRNFGAGALEWCYLAANRFDVYLHGSQKMWDYAAGALILEESGGEMRSIRHPNFWEGDLWTKGVIAANSPELFEQWESWIRGNVLDFIGR